MSTYSFATVNGELQITDNSNTDGRDGTDTLVGIETVQFKNGSTSVSSPVVLDLDGDGVSLIDREASHVGFDWNGDGREDRTGWIDSGDGFLAIDRNGDGSITDGAELSFVDDKPGAKSDLDGLSAFDSNSDGILSAADEQFGKFGVWRDANGNGRNDVGEFQSLAAAGIKSVSLTGSAVNREWAIGDNITLNTGSFTRSDGSSGALGDVALSYTSGGGGAVRRMLPTPRSFDRPSFEPIGSGVFANWDFKWWGRSHHEKPQRRHLAQRELVAETAQGGAVKHSQDLPRVMLGLDEADRRLSPSRGASTGLLKQLSLMRQDMSSFAAEAGEFSAFRRLDQVPLDWHA